MQDLDKKLAKKITAMREGGRVLGKIKRQLVDFCQPGLAFEAVEAQAQELIRAASMTPSFSTVPGYYWATCIMKNEEICHGIPVDKTMEDGDLITIDVGLINQGYHLDTTISFGVGQVSGKMQRFLEDGQSILRKAINRAKVGSSVYDISYQMDKGLQKKGYGVVYQLTGHGIGEELHMEPEIPVFAHKPHKKIILQAGQTLAIEVMYTMGKPQLVTAADGWTYKTADGSLSGMFEETVLVTENGPEILTKAN